MLKGHPLLQDTTWVSQNDVTAWRWFFGDPASGAADSSHLENPTHSFTAPGDYDVTLISYSTEGCSDTLVKQITIDSLPDVSNTSHYKIICSHDSTDILLHPMSALLFYMDCYCHSPDDNRIFKSNHPVSYLNQHLSNNGNEIDSVIYSVVPHNGTCAGTIRIFMWRFIHIRTSPMRSGSNRSATVHLQISSSSRILTRPGSHGHAQPVHQMSPVIPIIPPHPIPSSTNFSGTQDLQLILSITILFLMPMDALVIQQSIRLPFIRSLTFQIFHCRRRSATAH